MDADLQYGSGVQFLADAGGWQRWFLAGVALAVSVFIVVWLFRLAPADRGLVIPLGLILGGGVGNLIDRVSVTWWILFHCTTIACIGPFNIADSAITGVAWWRLARFSVTLLTQKPSVS